MGLVTLVLIGLVLVSNGNRTLNEKCVIEVEENISESVQDCRKYWIGKTK